MSAALVASAEPGTSRGRWMSVYISAGNFELPIGPFVLGLLLESVGLGGTWLVALPALAVAPTVWRLGPLIAARREPAPLSLRGVLHRERRWLAGVVAVSATLSGLEPHHVVPPALRRRPRRRRRLVIAAAHVVPARWRRWRSHRWLARPLRAGPVIIASLVAATPFYGLLALQAAARPPSGSRRPLQGCSSTARSWSSRSAGRSLPGLGMVSGLTLGLWNGVRGLAVTPMAAVAGRAGLPVVLYAAGLLAVAGAAVMSRVPKPPHLATVAPEAQAAASQACSFAPVTFLLRRRPSR